MQRLRSMLTIGRHCCGVQLRRFARGDFMRVEAQRIVCPARPVHHNVAVRSKASPLTPKAASPQCNKGSLQRKNSTKGTKSPEEELLRKVNTLVGQRNAHEAVRVVKSALWGEWPPAPPPQGGAPATDTNSVSASSSRTEQRAIFSSKAFAAALYACDAANNAADGLSLVSEVRRHTTVISNDWLRSEHVLFAVLRLQCAAGDRDGATHMFAYLEQHGMLRLRSASVFLRYCCFKLQDRRLAFAVYEKALQHKIELTEPDYVALGTVCVQLCEPISTLFFMLEEMKEHVPGVSAAFLADVVEPWVAIANSANSRIGGAKTTRVPRYHVATVARMEQQERTALQSTSKALLNSAEVCLKDGGSDKNSSSCAASSQPLIQACGVCPVCHTELSGYAFTAACRNHLLSELKDLVIPQACRSRRALLGFEHWKRYIHARYDSGDRVDVFIDGANLGYYGLSSWYDLAKKQLLLHRGVAEGQITAQDLNFNEQCKASAKGVDVGVNFDLIDSAVKLAVEKYGLRRPLVMLHERHVEPRFMTPQAAVIVQHWRSLGWLYCTPTGLNDDLCWLYGALLMTDPTDRRGEGRQRAATAASTSHRTLVCTNDKMRDHHFRLLSPRAFTRWRDRHRIGFRCGRVENRTELYWDLPAPYARCIQRHDLVLPPPPSSTTSASPEGERVKAENGGAAVSTWHIPFSKDPAVSSAASFLSSMRTAEGTTAESCSELDGAQLESGQQANPSTDGDPIVEQADGDNDELHASTDIQESSPWICVTVEA